MIEEDAEQARLLVAILASVSFIALQMAIKPFKRCAAMALNAISDPRLRLMQHLSVTTALYE